MQCPDCDHQNTSGAWLCINCGSKLPRDGDPVAAENPEREESSDEPSRFEPAISENLRRLRERASGERSSRPVRPGNRGQRRPGPVKLPEMASGQFLGLPWAFWATVIFLFFVTIMVLSNLQ